MKASAVQQEYLAEAYRLAHYQPDDPYITTSALAERLGVSAPAAAAAIGRLKRAGYVEHEPYRGMKLTPEGEHEALMSIRRHRLSEVFLVKVMGFGWHEVHDQADAIGAVVSEPVVARMEKMAGYPRRCPHGEPIPSADGDMPEVIDEPLADIAPPAECTVSRIHTHDADILQYLETLDLMPGRAVSLVSHGPFNGPLRLRLNSREQIIGHELARVIRVENHLK